MSTDRSPDPYENAGTYEARYQITKPSAKGYAKEAENKARNSSADNTKNDIHEYAGVAIHEVDAIQPARPPMIIAAIQPIPASPISVLPV